MWLTLSLVVSVNKDRKVKWVLKVPWVHKVYQESLVWPARKVTKVIRETRATKVIKVT